MLESGDLESISARVLDQKLVPEPRSGRQEILENIVNAVIN